MTAEHLRDAATERLAARRVRNRDLSGVALETASVSCAISKGCIGRGRAARMISAESQRVPW